MPSGKEPIEERPGLEAYVGGRTTGDHFSFSYRTLEVRADGDFGVERGNYVLAFNSGSDKAVRTESGNLMRIVEKAPDGSWHIASEIWNVVLSSGSE
jgi:ketosteroid isomerase-like protein